VVDDFVNLMDLAPTFLEAAGVEPPAVMTGRSLMSVLSSRAEPAGAASSPGPRQVDPSRTWVVTGRERHVAAARDGQLPYPQRAIRTKDYLYILNFAPDRWPMGNPYNLDSGDGPSLESLTEQTFVTFMDMDAGPTKAWLVSHRDDPRWKRHYDLAFARRPREELYVLADDPHQVRNRADDPQLAAVRQELHDRLMAELKRTGDPRVIGDGGTFEKPPFAGPVPDPPPRRPAQNRARK
jgi:arylsulfatase A-like enzyme